MMLICLSLAAICKVAEYVHCLIILPEGKSYLFKHIVKETVYAFIAYMFLNIAGLMNIAKWAYFIIVAKIHIDIRR